MALKQIEIYFVTPKEATNLVINPQFGVDTTGYTAVGAGVSIARVTTYQRRGTASCEITTATNVASGLYYAIALTSGTAYTFSADVLDVNGQTFNLYFANTSGTLQGTATTWTGTGHWVRKSVTWTATSSTTFRLYLTRSSVASTTKFYTDGWQLEADSAATTYFDGNNVGFNRLRRDYRWNGTAHASTSWRSGKTRSGGSLVRLRDYANLIGTVGLGMMSLVNNAVPTSGAGSYYQSTRVPDREFQISVQFQGTEHNDVIVNRQAIIAAVRPDNVIEPEPITVRWQLEDENGAQISYPVDFFSVYEGGLEHDTTGQMSQFEDKATMRFRSFIPFAVGDGNAAYALGYQTTVSNFANIGYRDTDGTWKAMGTGASGGSVQALAKAEDGSIYAVGGFSSMGGVANTDMVARWNGTAWEALGTGITGTAAFAVAIGPDGAVYIGGNFTNAAGIAAADYIVKWDGASWSALGTGMNGIVLSLSFDSDGILYAGGGFTSAGGVASTAYIAKWNGTAWSAMGSGASGGQVNTVHAAADGSVYAGGQFTAMGGVADTAYIARWNGTAWNAMGTGMDDFVNSISSVPNGLIYAAGLFTVAGGVDANYIAAWNGSGWAALNSGADNALSAVYGASDGLVYIGGGALFTSVDGIVMPDKGAIWHGDSWGTIDVDVQDTAAEYMTYLYDPIGRLYIGGLWTGTDALSATITVSNSAGAASYPIIRFTGPGTLWQVKNYTTGRVVKFANLTLPAGETATLDLRPGRLSFTSSFRGNIMKYILPGSSLDFPLLAGNNNVSAYMTGTTAASAIAMLYTNYYWGTDGAVW